MKLTGGRMLFFGNKKNKGKPPESMDFLLSLDGKKVRYVTLRNTNDHGETIIGKSGVINIVNDELVIVCNSKIVFRHRLADLHGSELMSLDGVVLTYRDEASGEETAAVAYYQYYRK